MMLGIRYPYRNFTLQERVKCKVICVRNTHKEILNLKWVCDFQWKSRLLWVMKFSKLDLLGKQDACLCGKALLSKPTKTLL